ncbi:hypothetical protein [Nitrosomonas sp.]|uniref:hypothetical protein n=1 Tax=Nitrosomonas sp. TaxID=42353 RepID=UPI00208B695D|nr:hypothetical protein [Nitrosomonas sp.]GJL76467.1 MAG: hypothetical protein NMNS02_25730 [Nitrosomonas sp.]
MNSKNVFDGLPENSGLITVWVKLAQVQAQRFFIEHNFHEAKSECGMAEYQVRRWDAWHHHIALVMLATLFLVKQKMLGRRQWPMLSINELVSSCVANESQCVCYGNMAEKLVVPDTSCRLATNNNVE